MQLFIFLPVFTKIKTSLAKSKVTNHTSLKDVIKKILLISPASLSQVPSFKKSGLPSIKITDYWKQTKVPSIINGNESLLLLSSKIINVTQNWSNLIKLLSTNNI